MFLLGRSLLETVTITRILKKFCCSSFCFLAVFVRYSSMFGLLTVLIEFKEHFKVWVSDSQLSEVCLEDRI